MFEIRIHMFPKTQRFLKSAFLARLELRSTGLISNSSLLDRRDGDYNVDRGSDYNSHDFFCYISKIALLFDCDRHRQEFSPGSPEMKANNQPCYEIAGYNLVRGYK